MLALLLKMLSDCWLERVVPCADAHSAVEHEHVNKTGVLQDLSTDLLTPLLAKNARAQGVQRFAGTTCRSLRQPQRIAVIP